MGKRQTATLALYRSQANFVNGQLVRAASCSSAPFQDQGRRPLSASSIQSGSTRLRISLGSSTIISVWALVDPGCQAS